MTRTNDTVKPGEHRKKRTGVKQGAWVLVWYLELECDSNQTEGAYPSLFENRSDAIDYAKRTLKKCCRMFDRNAEPDELLQIEKDLGETGRGFIPMSLVQLSDSDNVVFELSYNRIRSPRTTGGRHGDK